MRHSTQRIQGESRGRHTVYILPDKVHVFKTLFNKMREKIGHYDNTREYIGLSTTSLDWLEKGKLSAYNAKKILDAYNKMYGKR